MIVTIDKLNKLDACREGIAWFVAQKEIDLKAICYALIDDNHISWANWLMVRCLNNIQNVQYAVFAAEQVIDIFEREHPKDPRPRKAIEAAKAWIREPGKESAYTTAADAAAASYAAASSAAYAAAAAAAYAAASSAASSSYAASYAYAAASASYAASSAHAAASAAAAASARKTLQIKIIDYGISLIEEVKA